MRPRKLAVYGYRPRKGLAYLGAARRLREALSLFPAIPPVECDWRAWWPMALIDPPVADRLPPGDPEFSEFCPVYRSDTGELVGYLVRLREGRQ